MFDRSALVVLLLAGCNQIYGLDPTTIREAGLLTDIDLDGVGDDVDPCLAPVRDEIDDMDADGVLAKDDACPFDDVQGTDADADGVPDACDPFRTSGGDRLRCYMSFGSTELNARLWKGRGTMDWTSREGELYVTLLDHPTGVVSTIDLEGTQTTFETFVSLANSNTTGPYAFRLWARAAETPDNKELGCEISGTSGSPASVRVAVVRGNDMDIAARTLFTPFPLAFPTRVALTIARGGSGVDVRCRFRWSTFDEAVKATVAEMPVGRVAFGTEELAANVSALAIYERDDVQPLP